MSDTDTPENTIAQLCRIVDSSFVTNNLSDQQRKELISQAYGIMMRKQMSDGKYKVNLELINYEWFQDLMILVCNNGCQDLVPDVREIKQNLLELGDRTKDKTVKVAVLRSAMKITA